MEKERNQAYADAYLLYSSLQNAIQENTESAETFYQKEYEDYYVLMQLYESKDYVERLNQKLQLQHNIYTREINWLKEEQGFPLTYTLQDREHQAVWTTYMLEHDILPYATPYENKTVNFFYQFLQSNVSLLIFFLIAVSIVPMIVCRDFEEDVYKHVYTAAIPRERVLLAKLLVAITVIAAFRFARPYYLAAVWTWLPGLSVSDGKRYTDKCRELSYLLNPFVSVYTAIPDCSDVSVILPVSQTGGYLYLFRPFDGFAVYMYGIPNVWKAAGMDSLLLYTGQSYFEQ